MKTATPRPVDAKQLSEAGLRAFFRIADHWELSARDQQILLGVQAPSTFFKWKKDPRVRLPHDALERISYLLGIFKDLDILLPDPEAADRWVRQPNDAQPFGGRSALDLMLQGQMIDLFMVRQYLDRQRDS